MVTEGQPLSDDNASFLRAARGGNLEKVLEYLKASTDINTCNANGLNALHLASKEGHVSVVEELLARGAKIDSATKKGNTALHIASLAGQEAVVKILVEAGSAVNVQSQNGFTPLYMAAQENHDGVVRFLLASGANQSLATEDGFTPLAVALQQGHDKVVAVLLENDTRGKVRLPALHIAAKKDDTKAAGLLLQNDHNPDVTSKSGFTPLHIAAHYGNENIAALLLQRNANVNYAAKHNITPLHVAAKWGKANMVALLLDKGANLEAKTRDGLTPLHCAARSGHENVVDMMVQRGAPISAKTKNGLAPLHMASQGDHVDAARILLHHKAPVDEVTVDYLTALHVAAHCGHVRVAKLLLDRKADPNARALNGFTPLHIACKKNRIKVVELLLKYGASIEATTESGLTPLHVASFMGCMNIVIFLIQHQASPDEATVRGETPLHLAARANQTDIIRILLRNGAQVDARAREQQTPLHIASRLGNVDIVVLLLQSGAQVDATTKDLYTALHIAAKEGQEEVASVLLEHKASLTAATKKGFTPLHLAAKYGNLKVSRLLLEKDAPVDAEGKNGVTPLHVAAHYDHQNVALLLLDKGASPHAAAKNGYTPLHITAKKNQLDIAASLLEYGAKTDAESKAGFTPLHLAAQEGHMDMGKLLLKHSADPNAQAKNGLAPIHLCAQEDKINVAEVLAGNEADLNAVTKAGYSPLHVAAHFGSASMVKFLLDQQVVVNGQNELGYTPLHQAAQQGHSQIVSLLLETGSAEPNIVSNNGQTALSIAQRLGYISVVETLKVVTEQEITTTTTTTIEEKYKVLAPESMQETFMSDSEDEGGEENMLGESSYKYLTVDEMKSLGDDSMPIDVTHDEKLISTKEQTSTVYHQRAAAAAAAPGSLEEKLAALEKTKEYHSGVNNASADNVDLPNKSTLKIGSTLGNHSHLSLATSVGNRSVSSMWRERFLVSFMVDARGGAMRGCRHSGVRVIIPPRKAPMPMRITCRYLKKDKLIHPPPLMEGEAIASRVLELGPSGAKFLGPVIIEVPHFAALRGKEREIVILRSDNGETWREHTLEATEEAVQEVLQESFDPDELTQLEDLNTTRITRILTTDFPQYFAIVSRIRQEVHAIGPEGGVVNSTVVPQVQAVFPQGALTKKIKVGLQAQPIPPELTAKLLGNRVAVSPIVTVEPRRRKFHKPITLTIPVPQAAGKGMINQYNGETPTLRLLCSITGGTTRAQWEDVTGSTPLHFVNDCVNFTTTVSARFWLMDCRNVGEATKMATELYREAIHVPFMAKFVVFSKRHEVLEARLRVFCMTDDKEEKTLEGQEHFGEIAKSRDVEVLEGKSHFVEFGGNLVPVTKSGDQLSLRFYAFRENRLPFNVRVKDPNSEPMGRIAFMKEPKSNRQDAPQNPICTLNLGLPDNITPEAVMLESADFQSKVSFLREAGYGKFDTIHKADLKISDIGNLLGSDWVKVAHELDIPDSDINIIKSEYPENEGQQAMVMLRLWLNTQGNKATGNALEKALRRCEREDIITKCIFNVELVTDESEKHGAQVALEIQEEVDECDQVEETEEIPEHISQSKHDITEYKHAAEELITEKMEVAYSSGELESIEVKKQSFSEDIQQHKEAAVIYEQEEQKYSAEEKEVITKDAEFIVKESLIHEESSHVEEEDHHVQEVLTQEESSHDEDEKVEVIDTFDAESIPTIEVSIPDHQPPNSDDEENKEGMQENQVSQALNGSQVETECEDMPDESDHEEPVMKQGVTAKSSSSSSSGEEEPEVVRELPVDSDKEDKVSRSRKSSSSSSSSSSSDDKDDEKVQATELALDQRQASPLEQEREEAQSPVVQEEFDDDVLVPKSLEVDEQEIIQRDRSSEVEVSTGTSNVGESPEVVGREETPELQVREQSPKLEPKEEIQEAQMKESSPIAEATTEYIPEVGLRPESPDEMKSSSSSSSSSEAGDVIDAKQSVSSSCPEESTDYSIKPKEEESSQLRQDTLDDQEPMIISQTSESQEEQKSKTSSSSDNEGEAETCSSTKPAFQIQIATEQEVEPDDFYQVHQAESEEAKSEGDEAEQDNRKPDMTKQSSSKTPPPSPAVEFNQDTQFELEGADTSLDEAVSNVFQEQQARSSHQQEVIQSDDDASKEDDSDDLDDKGPHNEQPHKEEDSSIQISLPHDHDHTNSNQLISTSTAACIENNTNLTGLNTLDQWSPRAAFDNDEESQPESMEDKLIPSHQNGQAAEAVPPLKTYEELEAIKQIATDFVKSLSQEALEIVKDKQLTPDINVEEDKPEVIPQVQITFSMDLSDNELVSDMTDLREELSGLDTRIPDQFQFQTSFRAHFVTYFESEAEQIMRTNLAQAQSRTIDDVSEDELEDDYDTKASKPPTTMMESSEDIWAGEDSVMLRKSKTTFSVKSSKTDSESISSEMKRLSGTDQDGSSFHTAPGSSSSRPSSSDVDAMLSAISGRGSSMTTTTEYETANSHNDFSSSYHTAKSTKSSMSSDNSGNVASFEHSETSDTLIDISIEQDRETPHGVPQEMPEEETSSIVRSPEMLFQEEEIECLMESREIQSSASDTATVLVQSFGKSNEDVMQKSLLLTESTCSTNSSEKAIHTPPGSGEMIIEDLKKDDSPAAPEAPEEKSFCRVVSFDTANLQATSPKATSLRDQKSFDSDFFDSRPESELKDFESRPHSISDAMMGDSERITPECKGDVSDTEMDYLKKHCDPFQRPFSPEPPASQTSPMDENAVKTEMAFSTHFTQVIEDEEEFEKLDEFPEYQVMTAVEVLDPVDMAHLKLRSTQSFDLAESSAVHKPLSGERVWEASVELNLEDEDKEPLEKKKVDEPTFEDEINWDEQVIEEHPQVLNAEGEFLAFPYNPPLDQIIEEEEDHDDHHLKDLQHLKESLSSTPEFDHLASEKRTLVLRLGEKDANSMSSLQEFETLEQEFGHSGSGSRGSIGSQDSLELGPATSKPSVVTVHKKKVFNVETSSHGSSGSLQEFEQMEDACLAAEHLEHKAKHQETALSEIEEGHESQISESESCETLSQGGKSDDSTEFTQRMQQIDEIIRQAQTNVETFDPAHQYMSQIMEASTDSLDGGKVMVTSTDSLEEKLLPTEDLMKISTNSIELGKKVMVASTDSLESGSANTRAMASMYSSYASSNTSETFVSADLEKTTSSLGRVIEESSTTVTTSQCHISYGFNVSEVILPSEGGLARTIERTVEMPAEVTKIQFKGPEAEQKMHEYMDRMGGAGSSLQEVESVDASGNVIHKRVIQNTRMFPSEES